MRIQVDKDRPRAIGRKRREARERRRTGLAARRAPAPCGGRFVLPPRRFPVIILLEMGG